MTAGILTGKSREYKDIIWILKKLNIIWKGFNYMDMENLWKNKINFGCNIRIKNILIEYRDLIIIFYLLGIYKKKRFLVRWVILFINFYMILYK